MSTMSFLRSGRRFFSVGNKAQRVRLGSRHVVKESFTEAIHDHLCGGIFSSRTVGNFDRGSLHNCTPPGSLLLQTQQRFFSSSSLVSKPTDDDTEYPIIDYNSPLGDLISRLKMVSITGCVLSVCVLPALVFLKNGDLPSARQATLGTFATIGATGSTAALHFVFGAYVLDMKSIADNSSDDGNNRYMLEATTRSIFGFWKHTHVFDPRTDVTPYVGPRPFANFCANDIPLFVHPERLDAVTRKLLLHSDSGAIKVDGDVLSERNQDRVNEGTMKKQKRKGNDDDEEFF